MQTAIEWLYDKWSNCKEWKWEEIEQWFEQAKEMEKQQIIDAAADHSYPTKTSAYIDAEIYYDKTYGSKGSDENFKQFSLYEHKETITSADTKVSTSFLENTPTSSQTEISDEDIKKFASDFYDNNGADEFIIIGAKWYREQLKTKKD